MNAYHFHIDPVSAPRMTQRDKFSPSKAVSRYFAFRNELKYLAYINHLEEIPGTLEAITFSIPMPASWSNKKRESMKGKPHQQTPDLDNLLKAFLDGLCSQDNYIHCIGRLEKVWAEQGSIQLEID